ncbi:MAG: universal stress protein [Actinomycetes bacterium]
MSPTETVARGPQVLPHKEIVVGLDGSTASAAALVWAAEQARVTGRRLRVVHCWQRPVAELYDGAESREARAQDAHERATRWVLDALGRSAQVPEWVLDVAEGAAGPVLVERSRTAALVVVGSRDRAGVRHLVAGSVAHHVLRHASCPVVSVPVPAADDHEPVHAAGGVAPAVGPLR